MINVNIQDVTDVSGYIDALGQEAASKAINEARIKVAQADRDGQIGASEAQRDQRIQVANANATATKGENVAGVEIANSNADRRSKEAEAERLASAAEKVASARSLEEAYASEQKRSRSAPSATRPHSMPTSSCRQKSRAIGFSSKPKRKPNRRAAPSKARPTASERSSKPKRTVCFSFGKRRPKDSKRGY